MRFLIVLDANSTIGRIYANGSNDGFVNDGHQKHPVLDCIELTIDNPYYIFAIREMKKAAGSRQSLYLPHGSVAAIHLYDVTEPHPLGFLPQK